MKEKICQAAVLFITHAKHLILIIFVVSYIILSNLLTYVQNIYNILIRPILIYYISTIIAEHIKKGRRLQYKNAPENINKN